MADLWTKFKRVYALCQKTGRLMVGIPDYDNYVAQQRKHNPHAPVMDHRQFLDYCHNRRAAGKGSRCC